MATVSIPDASRYISDQAEVKEYLSNIGIEFEKWVPEGEVSSSSTPDEILKAFAPQIEELKKRGGYTTADVIDLKPDLPGLEGMLEKFRSEHWHDEDEVRYTIEGRGLFHIHPRDGEICVIEVVSGDLIRIPRNTLHWFDLCDEKRIRAIRLFQNISGWTPYYSGSGVDRKYEPVCFGPSYISSGK